MLHFITQNPYSPNPMHYLQLSFLDPSGLCCIATEKIWWLLTKFIINNHLTVEEKICHRK
ncbi:hypothetical protein ACJZL1_05865 [Wolbachia endosymbiont of Rhagoletis indifferens]|uniref:hypothetical protein n=1 Tax=Wolbachia endosymbiont of Rhagoletis indifferens TaxID=3383250 RepID=UPI003AF3485A